MTIKQAAIDVIAHAMAEANHIGKDRIPERDVRLYHERAKLFLAASAVLPNVKSSDYVAEPPKGAATWATFGQASSSTPAPGSFAAAFKPKASGSGDLK